MIVKLNCPKSLTANTVNIRFGEESTGVTHETGKVEKYVGNPRSLVLTCTLSSCVDCQQMLAEILALKSLKRLEGFAVTKM